MRKVVSNTTPLISLLKIGKLEILRNLYGEILVPQAVFNEIEAGKTKEFYIDISETGWIRIEKIKNRQSLTCFFGFGQRRSRSNYPGGGKQCGFNFA
jgi:predicted nucleic acid-binding protein